MAARASSASAVAISGSRSGAGAGAGSEAAMVSSVGSKVPALGVSARPASFRSRSSRAAAFFTSASIYLGFALRAFRMRRVQVKQLAYLPLANDSHDLRRHDA